MRTPTSTDRTPHSSTTIPEMFFVGKASSLSLFLLRQMDNWLEAYSTSVEQDKECCDRTWRQSFFCNPT